MLLLRSVAGIVIALVWQSAQVASSVPAVTPAKLYEKALTSDLKFSYQGQQFITTYDEDGRSSSYMTTVLHRAPDDFKIKYIAPARDAGRIIVEDGDQQWTLLPKQHSLIHSKQQLLLGRKQLAAKFALLSQNYNLSLDPHVTSVAQRKVFLLLISPKAVHGTVSKLWIDPDTGLILRKEQYHADGQLDMVMYYSDLLIIQTMDRRSFSVDQLLAGKPKIVETGEPDEERVKRGSVAQLFSRGAVVPESIGGFQLQSLMLMRGTKMPTLHLRYSDGFTSLSLFEVARTPKTVSTIAHSRPVLLRPDNSGRVVSRYSYNLLNWDSVRFNFTLVGDVRLSSLIDFAKSTHLFD